VLHRLISQFRGAKHHAASSMWGIGEYFAYPLMMFLVTPFFLHWLGEAQYGQWMLLLAFNSFGGLAGLGMGATATRDVAAARGRADPGEALAAVQACLSVTLLSSAIVGLALLTFGFLAGGDLLARMGSPNLIRSIISIAAILIFLEQLDTVFTGTVRGMERFDLSARAEALTKAAFVAGALIAAWVTHELYWVFVATVAMTLLRLVVKVSVASHLLGAIPRPTLDRRRMAAVFAFGKWTWVQALGAVLFSTADRFLVGGVLGAEALARYSICVQLAQQVHTVPAAGAQFLFPAIARKRQKGVDYRRLAFKASFFLIILVIMIALPIGIFADLILQLWVGSEIATNSASTLVLLVLGFALLGATVGPYYVLLGAGHARYVALWNIAAGIVAAVVIWIALDSLDMPGAALGRIAYAMLICLSMAFFVKWHPTR
jgi:O-antigen/teichoic acid export membrane protein